VCLLSWYLAPIAIGITDLQYQSQIQHHKKKIILKKSSSNNQMLSDYDLEFAPPDCVKDITVAGESSLTPSVHALLVDVKWASGD
jgi:hypothetical protein